MSTWDPDEYFNGLMKNVRPVLGFRAGNREEWMVWRDELRERFVKMLGGYPVMELDLRVTKLEEVDCGDYIRERIEFETYPGLRMPVYVLTPKQSSKKRPAVVACHGHGYGSKDIVGLNRDGTERVGDPGYHKDFAVELVRRGFVTVAPEMLGFGDRKLQRDRDGDNSCHNISTLLLAFGQTMAGYRVFEMIRCVDYLLTREDVDARRIGCMGISGGGLVCSFAAAIDERISSAVVSGYINTFEASILSIHHCVDNYVPGLSLIAEMPDVVGLIAPRPLLIESGRLDPIFPVQATLEAYLELRRIYAAAGAPEGRLSLDLFDGGHQISGQVAYDWLAQQINQ